MAYRRLWTEFVGNLGILKPVMVGSRLGQGLLSAVAACPAPTPGQKSLAEGVCLNMQMECKLAVSRADRLKSRVFKPKCALGRLSRSHRSKAGFGEGSGSRQKCAVIDMTRAGTRASSLCIEHDIAADGEWGPPR